MKTNTAGAIVIAVLFFCLLVAIVFCFVQRAEAERQSKLAEEVMERLQVAEKVASVQREMAMAAQREAEVQRMMAQQHLIQAEEALAKCRGTK
ncbi:MAG: hypothetical protein ACK5DD_08695 [Cyclobacteriaceae bacterium]|jgi:ABC-type branched-subunit amino acid transport system ATPase component